MQDERHARVGPGWRGGGDIRRGIPEVPGPEDGEPGGEAGPDRPDGQGMAHAHPRHQEVCGGLPGDVR